MSEAFALFICSCVLFGVVIFCMYNAVREIEKDVQKLKERK